MSTIPTFNKFKSTTVYGAFNNLDYEDNTVQASSNIQRNLTVGGDIIVATGNIKGKKLFYDNVDISSLFASTLMPIFKSSINLTVLDPILNAYTFTIDNTTGIITMNTYAGTYPLKINASNLQLSKNNGTNYYDVLTTNTGALLSGATFTGNVSGITPTTSDNSNSFATTAFVKAQNYLTSNPDLSPYALLSGAFFTGNISGLTAVSTDSSNKLATTAFVKAQGYINNGDLSPYALLGGATFTGNVAGLTALSTDNTNKFATTAFVKTQNYITSAPLIAYALLSGATFNGAVNCNNGLTTAAGKDVHISCNNTFPTTNSGGKQGLGFFWNQTGGRGEVDLLTYGQGGAGGLSIWNSNVTNAPSKIVEFYPDGSTFNTTVNITQPSSTSSAVLQFLTDTGIARANIYSSFVDSRFCFDIRPLYNEYGFEWRVSGEPIMRLGLNGDIITDGSISTPYTKIGSQEIISQSSITLSFPLLSSYLIQTTQPVSVYLPVITANWEMGVEVLFIKNSGTCNIYAANNNVIIDSLFFQSASINVSQYRRLISTKLSSGIFGWMIIANN